MTAKCNIKQGRIWPTSRHGWCINEPEALTTTQPSNISGPAMSNASPLWTRALQLAFWSRRVQVEGDNLLPVYQQVHNKILRSKVSAGCTFGAAGPGGFPLPSERTHVSSGDQLFPQPNSRLGASSHSGDSHCSYEKTYSAPGRGTADAGIWQERCEDTVWSGASQTH